MDSDLAESVAALKDIFAKRGIPASFGKAETPVVEELKKTFRVPSRYRAFLLAADPIDVETVTPVERVRLASSTKLASEQTLGGKRTDEIPNWRKSWVIIARSALLGDPYFLDVSKLDAEGDCPIYTCMIGTDTIKPELCASSFQQFLRILATSMEVATGFGEAVLDDDDEAIFREALAPKIKTIDSAALRAGHWT
ncbi:SMI1/KNR4 family protein [Polyangium aurulentum]|uniref:SMI1/KNR4 family protein n=1 Tax=Polyangium aurulentum TaxID=2567896 RepID=UPI001F43730F|nr:SMI1/KNR4 family protein [Polyangium aurulentum]